MTWNLFQINEKREMDAATFSDWIRSLQGHLDHVLTPIIPNRETRNKYLHREAMKVWITAFTHESFDNINNYEDLEFIGDRGLKTYFGQYVMIRFNKLHKDSWTILESKYMSGEFQKELARNLGFDRFVRATTVSGKVIGDVFESFFGALGIISDMIVDGLGFATCYNMLVHILDGVEMVASEEVRLDDKTFVRQFFSRFHLPDPEEIVTSGKKSTVLTVTSGPRAYELAQISQPLYVTSGPNMDKIDKYVWKNLVEVLEEKEILTLNKEVVSNFQHQAKVEIKLLPQHLRFLQEQGYENVQDIIGEASANTETGAAVAAYAMAGDFLRKPNLDLREIKDNIDLKKLKIPREVALAIKKAQEEGYSRIGFNSSKKLKTIEGEEVRLMGIKGEERHILLGGYLRNNSGMTVDDLRRQLILDYLEGVIERNN